MRRMSIRPSALLAGAPVAAIPSATPAASAFRASRCLFPGGLDIAPQIALDPTRREMAIPF